MVEEANVMMEVGISIIMEEAVKVRESYRGDL